MEDAAVVRPPSGPALAFTVDFITPVVDDPYTFGAIAAANALSDVYAMGGRPSVALAVCGFPDDRVSKATLARIFSGGRDKAAEAGCAIAGGHTVLDPELKYGLCVLGAIEGALPLAHTHALPGDVLVLTKSIGSGIATQAIKQDRLAPADADAVVAAMLRLNEDGALAARAAGAHAATDVTGFGLLGHLHNLLRGSRAAARIETAAVPVFPFARALAAEGIVPGGTKRNLRYVEPHARFASSVDEATRLVLCDAQTSGGLLLAIPPLRVRDVVRELEARGALAAAVIGRVTAAAVGEEGRIDVV